MKKSEQEHGMVTLFIPSDPLNPDDTFVPVVTNGEIIQVKRGINVTVTKDIQRRIIEAGYLK
jgi:hypothetical protein